MELVHVKDKGFSKHSYYVPELYISDLKYNYADDCFNGFEIKSSAGSISGATINELVDVLTNLIKKYDLKVKSKASRELLIIYIDTLDKIRGWLYDFITYDGDLYVQVLQNIEFRSYEHFSKNSDDMADIWNKCLADRYMYLTPAQMVRKRMTKAADNELLKEQYPEFVGDYNTIMQAVHGGVLYCRKSSENITKDAMLGLDLTSAYIYGLVFKKHCCSKLRQIFDTTDWDKYLNNANLGSIGIYEIEYAYPLSAISCFKDINGQHLASGKHKATISLSNIDLNTLMNLPHMTILDIKCTRLFEFNVGYLPKEFRDYCISEYLAKQKLDPDSVAYKNQKVLLNAGFFGNLIINKVKKAYDQAVKDKLSALDCAKAAHRALKDLQAKPYSLPQWGVFTMSYCKELVLNLATKVACWVYSDTDSIYCQDSDYNNKLINEFNDDIRKQNRELCDKFGYEYDVIEDLGTFKTESKIKRFRSWSTKIYAYETIDGKTVVKAAGCNKEQLKNVSADEVFEPDYRPTVGTKIKRYYTETGYHEYAITGYLGLIDGVFNK